MTPGDAPNFLLRRPSVPPSFRPPPLHRLRTAGGLKIVLSEYHVVPLAHLYCAFDAGAEREPRGLEGLASIVMPLLKEGTGRRSAAQITEEVESLGADVLTYVNWDCGSLTVELLSRDLDFGVELLLDLITSPTFPDASVERLRRRHLDLLKRQAYQPAEVADLWFARAVYGEHTYGRALLGSHSSLNAIERGHLVDFHRSHLTPRNAVLVGIGSFDAEALVRRFEDAVPAEAFTTSPAPPTCPPPAAPTVRVHVVNLRGAAQTELRVGHVGVRQGHPDLARLHLLCRILTRRLNLCLRERLGYTYYARSRFVTRRGPGPFVTSAAVKSERVGAAVWEIRREVERLRQEPVTNAELEGARSHAAGEFVRSLQSSHEMALRLRHLALHDLPADYFQSHLTGLYEAAPEDLMELARRHLLPDRMTVIAVGDAEELRPQLSDQVQVFVIDSAVNS